MNKLPPIDIFGTLSDVAQTIPQLLWRPSINFTFDGEEPTHRRLTRLQKAWATSRSARPDTTLEEFLDMAKTCIPEVSHAMAVNLYTLIADLALQNTILFDRPDYDLNRTLTEQESTFIITEMGDLQTRLDNESRIYGIFKDTLIDILIALVSRLPSTADTASNLTVPLYALGNKELVLAAYYLPFFLAPRTPDPIADLATSRTRAILQNNALEASRLALEEAERHPNRIKWPDASLSSDEIVTNYLTGTPFCDFFQTPVPFSIPRNFYPEHTLIIAASGSGKTQYLQNLVLNFLDEPDPPGMFILDSQDDEKGILHKIANLAVFNDRLRDRLVILSPEDKPALNLFSFADDGPETDELFAYLMSAIDRDLTAKMSTASAYILRLLRKIEKPTIHTFKGILENPKDYQDQIAQLDQTSQDFFKNQFGVKSEMGATRLQVASRLYSILANRAFTDMFAAEENCFDAFDAMQNKKIVLVNTSERKLGSTGLKIFGRYMVAQVMAAAMKRGDTAGNRDLTLLMLDEAHEYFDAQTEKILRQARKFNVGLVAATQMYDQIEPKVKAALATNTTTKIIGRVSHADARDLANEIQSPVEFVRNLATGEFVIHVRGLTPEALVVKVPFGVLEAAPRMGDDAYRAMRDRNRLALTDALKTRALPPSADEISQTPPAMQSHQESATIFPPDAKLPPAAPAPNSANSDEQVNAEPLIKPGKDW